MISRDFLTEWRRLVPWPRDVQVEMDLIISRALVEIYSLPSIQKALAFRGGTALYKIHIVPPPRFSEDIDLVQIRRERIGETLNSLRTVLDPWMGNPRRDFSEGNVKLIYRLTSGGTPPQTMRLKIEINTQEHFAVRGYETRSLKVNSRWFSGTADITTYGLEELLATKLRALYQRKKGRDLFDLWYALQHANVSAENVTDVFQAYMEQEGHRVSRAEYEKNLARKIFEKRFIADIGDLLAPGTAYDQMAAYKMVSSTLVERLPGDPWRGDGSQQ
jgi:predicted nucleotidyltransferase component of viral defense system